MRRAYPTFVSLFTGAGGLDVGLESAGFRCVAATDFDRCCIETLRANQGARVPVGHGRAGHYLEGTKVIHADVASLGASALRAEDEARGWRPDLLAGGPPCQPFSSSGKQLALDDPRGRLFEQFVRIAASLRPQYVIFENVRGLVTARGPNGKPGEALALVRDAFEAIGYATQFRLLNAADYGVPQRRVRLFMLGTRRGNPPVFPEPTHAEARSDLSSVLPWTTLGDFLAAQPKPSASDVVRPTPALESLLRNVPEGSGLRSAGARERTRPGGHWGYRQGTFVADPRRPARTVTASSSQDWIRTDGVLRRLTERECAGLQGFPPTWTFHGNRASRFRQIGNAVPARFGEVLGREVIRALEAPSSKSNKPRSAPLPPDLLEAIAYTRREDASNGASRRRARRLQRLGAIDVAAIKGLGSLDGGLIGDAQPV